MVTISRVKGRDSVGTTLVAADVTPTTAPASSTTQPLTGPPLEDVPAVRVAVPDKLAAVEEQWTAVAEAVAQMEAAEAAAEAEAAEQAASEPRSTPTTPAPTAPAPTAPAPAPGGGGGGGGGGNGGGGGGAGLSLYQKLDNIAICESGQNPRAYNPAGPYYGAFQFHMSTWKSLGEKGDPRNKSYGYQREVAARLQQRSGWGSWPHCSAKYGYS